jgi:integrase
MGCIYRRASTPYYWAKWIDTQGRERRASTRCRDRRGAQAFLRREEGKAAEGVPVERGASLFDMIERWTTHVASYVAPSYLEKLGDYCRNHIAPYFGEVPITDLTGDAVAGYARHRLAKGIKPQTVNKELVAIRRMLAYCEDIGAIAQVPRIKMVRAVPRRIWRLLTDDQVEVLLAELPRRVLAFYVVAAYAGLRRGELWSLRWEDVDLDAGILHVRPKGNWTPKGRKARVVPLHERVVDSLRGLPIGTQTDLVFGKHEHRRAFQAAAKRAGLGHVRPHDLRHSLASNLLAGGADPISVRDILGHADLRTTNEYSHTTIERMKKAIVRVGSRPVPPVAVPLTIVR